MRAGPRDYSPQSVSLAKTQGRQARTSLDVRLYVFARAAIACLIVLLADHAAEATEPRAAPGGFRLATFSADVTPPLGHPLLGGATVTPVAARIDDRLFAADSC